jgi:hypothetical protein
MVFSFIFVSSIKKKNIMTQLNYSKGQKVEVKNLLTNEVYNGEVSCHYGSGDKTRSVWIRFEKGALPFSTKTGKMYGKNYTRKDYQLIIK